MQKFDAAELIEKPKGPPPKPEEAPKRKRAPGKRFLLEQLARKNYKKIQAQLSGPLSCRDRNNQVRKAKDVVKQISNTRLKYFLGLV